MKRWALWLPLFGFAAFVLLVLVGMLRPASHTVQSALVGKPMPALLLPAATDSKPSLAATATGKPRLVNVFASWCIPCAVEAPQLEALAKQGVEIDGIAIRDKPEDIAAFLGRHGNPYTRIGRDDTGTIQLALGSSGVPETYVVDKKGIIRYQHIGEIRPEHVSRLLDMVEEAGK